MHFYIDTIGYMFQPPENLTIAEREDKVIQYWKEHNTFQKSIDSRPEEDPYTFIDGPPFVSGMPHYGHLLTSVAKDLIPRYWTMKGKRVRRVWGWDCHGLPIEAKVNQKLNIKSAKEIEERVGIDTYIAECRSYVSSYSADWRWYIDKIGRWADLDNAYYTMSVEYMESVIWGFKQIYDKGLIYEGKRVSLFSTDTSTPVSNFEIAMDADNYQDVTDLSIFVKFRLKETSKFTNDDRPVYLVAWTTTPWTIPSNFALAVNENFNYSLVEYENELLIVATDRLEYAFHENKNQVDKKADAIVHKLKEFAGRELEGLTYIPVYSFFEDTKKENDFKVYLSDDVTITEGTGILHIAPAFGEVDFALGKKNNLSDTSDIDFEGKMIIDPWKGIYLRDASPLITEDLLQKGNLLRSEMHLHRLPFYRGDNPLIYMAQHAYFIDIQKIKDRMLELGQDINWIPSHVKEKRWNNTISTSPDWCISRNRYWLTIMPIWKSSEGDLIVIGSLEDFLQYTDQVTKETINGKTQYLFEGKPMDLHRDICDKIILKKDNKEYRRIPEVLDNWMDSGSSPFAEYHYPFENKDLYEKSMPGDFIIEYVGQVRAWFNVLHRISTMLFDRRTFTNVICHGVMAGNDGRKMSKTYGNYPDPKMVLEKYGADALRLYYAINPIFLGEDMNINEDDIADQVKSVMNIYWNSYKYFITYANTFNWHYSKDIKKSEHVMDRWILARLKETIKELTESIEAYNIPQASRLIRPFVSDISTWFIRRSRSRFAEGDTYALQTLYTVLVEFSKAAAPIIPFMTENVYQGLTGEESVHLAHYPEVYEISADEKSLLIDMEKVRKISSLGQLARVEAKQPVKQPLSKLEVKISEQLDISLLEVVAEELNIKKVLIVKDIDPHLQKHQDQDIEIGLDTQMNEELLAEGNARKLIREIQNERKKLNLKPEDYIILELPEYPTAFHDFIIKKVLAKEIKKGPVLKVLPLP
jgi:isoleucyl-tRNA synthetase